VVLLGALSALMEQQALTASELSADAWLNVIIQKVPAKYIELNRQAFIAGRQAVLGKL
jgi:Pyruvate/2-oxoacid:ferredoxin oxidoreductase gamma subunit